MDRRRLPSPGARPREDSYRRMEEFRRSDPDRRGPPPRDLRDGRRRPRSMSPPDRYPSRRSPPPSYNKRYRREDDYPPARYDRAPSPPYRRSPDYGRMRYNEERPPYRDEPRGPPPPQRPDDKEKPLGFREFMLHKLDDDVSPDEAQKRYQLYLAQWWGSQIRAEFEQKKNDEQARKLYDPREFEKALTRVKSEAQAAAQEFAGDFKDGKIDPTHADFNQGAYQLAPKPQTEEDGDKDQDESKAKSVPFVCWSASRVATDLKLSTKLVRKLDQEKEIAENVLLEHRDAENGEGAENGDANLEDSIQVDESNLQASLAKLDLLLTYLWRVHGLDYYGGLELNEHEFPSRLEKCRNLRGPCPEEGEEGNADEDKQALAELEKKIDTPWKTRLESGDPLLAKCQRQKIDDDVEAWIRSQIVKHDENKWGSKLSQKMFVGEKFVIKHIRLKHEGSVSEERDKIIDNLYWENFKAAKEEAEKRHREAQRKQQAKQRQLHQQQITPKDGPGFDHGDDMEGGMIDMYDGPNGEMMEDYDDGFDDGYDADGYPIRGGMRRGRMPGRGMGRRGAMPMMDGPFPIPPPPSLMGPPMGPAPVLIPAPGAGPLGPFVWSTMPPGAAPLPMDMDVPMMGRSRGGMRGRPRGRFMGPPGAKLDPRGIREYYDLDAPQNNRTILDYGDL